MPVPATIAELVELGCKAGLLDRDRANACCEQLRQQRQPVATPEQLAAGLVRAGQLTSFQAQQLLLGRWHGFILSKKYRLLECIGTGGMGSVYLCEHLRMHRLVAIKVLPAAQARDPTNLERFYREARAVAALNHPNIVRAHDIDQDQNLHYLVMEYVDGDSLQNIVKQQGPFDPARAAHYVAQAAAGLQHADEAGLVHRDIKPANLLLDRQGVVKILDLGLARFFHDSQDELTKKHDANAVLGTADYLAPEQAENSAVDIRADIYSLGCTFYFLLAGHAPFHDKTVPQKLVAHQLRMPKPIQALRNDVPAEMAAVLERMLAKKPAERFQQPQELVLALLPWTQGGISPPADKAVPASLAQRESTLIAGQETRITPLGRGRVPTPDLSEIPTAISTRPVEALQTAGCDDRSAAEPTLVDGVSLADTDPFGLSKAGGSLIAEDSVFCAQFTRAGSTQRDSTAAPRRNWVIVAALALIVVLAGFGGLLAYRNWFHAGDSGPIGQSPVSKPNEPGPPVSSGPEYVPAGSPAGTVVRSIGGATAPITGVALSPDGSKLIVATKDRSPKLWDAQTGKLLRNLVGHAQSVNCVAFAPDGETALTGSHYSLYVWDIKYGSQNINLKGLTKPVMCVAYVPIGGQGVSGGEDNLLHLWDLKTGNKIRSFNGHTMPVRSVTVASDGRRMLSGSDDGTARLWDLSSSNPLQEWKGHKGSVRAVAFSPEGRLAATGGQDKYIYLWDTDRNTRLQTFIGHSGAVTALIFSSDGRYLLSAAEDGTTRVWEPTTGQEVFRFKETTQPVTGLSLSADGALLAVGGPDQEVRLFRTPSYLHCTPAGQRYLFPESKSPVEAVAFSPDGLLAASAGHDRVIRLWDMRTFKQVRELPGHQDIITSLTFSADGQRLLSASRDKTARVWDVTKGTPLQQYQDVGAIQQAIFAPGGQRILIAGAHNSLRLWESMQGKPTLIHEFAGDTRPLLAPASLAVSQLGLLSSPKGFGLFHAATALIGGNLGPILGVAWAPDGKRFASAGADRTIRLWDPAGKQTEVNDTPAFDPRKILFAPDGSLLIAGDRVLHLWRFPVNGSPSRQTLTGQSDVVTSIAVSRNGRFALSGGKTGDIILWDLEKLRPVQYFFGHKGAVTDLAFAPDARLAMSGSSDGTLRLWSLPPCIADPVAGLARVIAKQPQSMTTMSLAPDVKTLATVGQDGHIHLLELPTLKEIGKLVGPGVSVRDVQFSPDGKWLVSAAVDGGVRLYKVHGLKEIHRFSDSPAKPMNAATFSPDGKRLLSGGDDKKAVAWDLYRTFGKAQEFVGHDGAITAVAYVPGGSRCLSASTDHTVRVWDLIDGKSQSVLKAHTAPVRCVAVAPNGKLAVSGGDDGAVCLWDLSSATLLYSFTGHTQPVECIAFSSDGLRVLSGSKDQTIRLWDVPRRQALAALSGSAAAVKSVTFTPDGVGALSCGQDDLLRLWTLPILHPAQFPWP
jgi:WD40 repeat protein/serine/threonine protein kinase